MISPLDSSSTRVPPLISIVIPTRDRLHYLKEAVASVHAQTIGDWELLIVDDASGDETASWLRSIADPRIRVLRMDQHVHRAKARNRGLSEASGDFVIFLDDDDRFRPRALEVLVMGLSRHSDASVACGARIEFDDRGHRRRIPHVRRPHLQTLWPAILGGWVAGTGQVMFRTEPLKSVGGWDEGLTWLQDWELLFRVSRRFGPAFLHPYAGREYRRHSKQWIPFDHAEAALKLERSFLASLPPRERAVGEGAARMRALVREANRFLYTCREPGTALRLFVAAYRAAPAVARSPMFRLMFIQGLCEAAVARVGGPATQRRFESIRGVVNRSLRRAPGRASPRRVVHDSAVRQEQAAR